MANYKLDNHMVLGMSEGDNTNSLSKSLIIGGSMVQYSRVIKMASRYKFSEEEIKAIQQARKGIRINEWKSD